MTVAKVVLAPMMAATYCDPIAGALCYIPMMVFERLLAPMTVTRLFDPLL